MSARCDDTGLPTGTCACGECRPDLSEPPPTAQRVTRRTDARRESKCRGCGGDIQVGDTIALLERDGWVCDDCADGRVP